MPLGGFRYSNPRNVVECKLPTIVYSKAELTERIQSYSSVSLLLFGSYNRKGGRSEVLKKNEELGYLLF
jgi:hypothetical protein